MGHQVVNDTREKKEKILNLRVSKGLWQDCMKQARANEMPVSTYVRLLIIGSLKKEREV